ncbi:MAG: chromate transporter [Rhodovibrio sp.]|nr:chromate transporter [Rhodovibrio sp.]
MLAFALGVGAVGDALGGGWIAGLKLAAVAVVANALLGMARRAVPGPGTRDLLRRRGARGRGRAAGRLGTGRRDPGGGDRRTVVLDRPGAGERTRRSAGRGRAGPRRSCCPRAVLCAAGGPAAAAAALGQGQALALLDAFYRPGALVFGGGHVVLPLLQAEVVPTGLVAPETFLAGYGAAQAVPGPLFAFAAFFGGAAGGVAASLIALVAIFLPGCLLVIGALPCSADLPARTDMPAALLGDRRRGRAARGGLLRPRSGPRRCTSRPTSRSPLGAFLLLAVWKVSPVIVVALGALAGVLLGAG